MCSRCWIDYNHKTRNMVDHGIVSRYRSAMDLNSTAARLEALGNPTRLSVYRALVRAGPDGLPVGTLHERTGVPRSTLSHHLHRLIRVGLVHQERQGTTLLCRADTALMRETLGFLLAECCVDAGAVLADEVSG